MTDVERRGGRRPGQGRPFLGVKVVHVSLDDDTISAARKIGDGELSRGLRVAVKEYQRKTTAEIASTEGT